MVDLDRIVAAVADADVIALQEVERYWPRSGMLDQPLELAKRLPDHWWIYGPALDVHTPAAGPGIEGRRRRQFGNMLLAKQPILASTVLQLPRFGAPERSMARVAVEGIIATGHGGLRVYSVHLCYLSPATRRIQMKTVADRHLNAVSQGGAWLGRHGADSGDWILGDEPEIPTSAFVLGDLNVTPDSPDYGPLCNAGSDHPYGLVDAWRVAGRAEQATFSGGGRIDYGLISRDLRPAVAAAWIDEAANGSDHYPVWFELDL